MKSFKQIPAGIKLMVVVGLLGFVTNLTFQLTGCATANPNAGQPILNPVTGQPVTVTNTATGVVTTNVQPPFVQNKAVTSAVNTISSLNDATAPLDPYSGFIKLGLGLTTLIAGGLAAWKNNQANGLNAQLTSVIQGVESATTDPAGNPLTSPIMAGVVKQSIASHAVAAGVSAPLAQKVLAVTA